MRRYVSIAKEFTGAKAGLGLRRGLIPDFRELQTGDIDFFEVAPENWIGLGGRFGRQFNELAERFPVSLHGLSLNIGGFAPLDWDLLGNIRDFIRRYDCALYSEHLTACADEAQLYDLMPIPFTQEAVVHVAERVRQVQDFLEQEILLENASYYTPLATELSEAEFIAAVLTEADCGLLLDVNNIHVNSINHGYDASEFLNALPLERVGYMHIAGHYVEAEDLRVDTHGSDVIEPVWHLLDLAYQRCGPVPTLLERDFNYPPMVSLLSEINRIRQAQTKALGLCSADARSVDARRGA
ncbi:DUF692 domain-containing protein [Spongiibacter sp. KMU-158]|uniref:UPF0276 protein IB286_05675 n=1 Tax=Spongiibacter pelagi TaxID=2760804 RepID=A0A927BZL3_9GAMM|nr:DUF692 domain-containing protein [Spongiibacter pelagi]MBD2858495.1 DUF692 domain-containing protein [Spongiibacter pelagi]